jgi:hypothetical protein
MDARIQKLKPIIHHFGLKIPGKKGNIILYFGDVEVLSFSIASMN